MTVDAKMVKELREKTGAGMMDCKHALVETGGDIEAAVEHLRKTGIAKAEKKGSRIAREGLVWSYIHPGGRLGVLLEINCETDFVAKTPDFADLAKNIAMQVAASNPLTVSRQDLPEAAIAREKEIYAAQARTSGKPEQIIDKIVSGRMEKYFQEVCLLEQPYIKDPDKKVGDLITAAIATLGEKIEVNRFMRYEIGENTSHDKAGD